MEGIKINITNNKYNIKITDLVAIGKRANNHKRNFLFISKILGKHLEVTPNVCKVSGYLLAHSLYEKISPFNIDTLKEFIETGVDINSSNVLEEKMGICSNNKEIKHELDKYINPKENVFVLGFAETATGLGMSVACAIKDSYYVTTTRENINDITSIFNFEETHSHATSHKCYLKDLDRLKNADRIILVDDEITTGNTILNLIYKMKNYSNAKTYTILTLLDWRNKESLDKYKDFEKEMNKNNSIKNKENEFSIEVKSIISGTIEVLDNTIYNGDDELQIIETVDIINTNAFEKITHSTIDNKTKEYIKISGRFGVQHKEIRSIENKAKNIANIIKKELAENDRILVLGHGENIYIPSRVASYLGNTNFKTTSRSPIFIDNEINYPIKSKDYFYVEGIKYYIYNKTEIEKNYDKVFLITEDEINIKLTDNIRIIKI